MADAILTLLPTAPTYGVAIAKDRQDLLGSMLGVWVNIMASSMCRP